MGIHIMVQRKESKDLEGFHAGLAIERPTPKVFKRKDVPRKTTKEHLSDFAGKPGHKIGGRGFIGG